MLTKTAEQNEGAENRSANTQRKAPSPKKKFHHKIYKIEVQTMVELRPITEENFEECVSLDVKEQQQDFIPENMCSLAEAYVAMTSGDLVPMPFGVYDAEQNVMVGFLMLGYCEEGDEDISEPYYCVWRIMTDANCQKLGYAKAALEKAIAEAKEMPLGSAAKLCAAYTADNKAAAALFASVGMKAGVPDEDGGVLAIMDL